MRNEQKFTRKGRRNLQTQGTAYTLRTHWHEITQADNSKQFSGAKSVMCQMNLLSTLVRRELFSLYGFKLELAPKKNLSEVWEAEVNQLSLLSDGLSRQIG